MKLHLSSNKASGAGGNAYREPLNDVTFPAIVTRLAGVLDTPSGGHAVGTKELQVFESRSRHGH